MIITDPTLVFAMSALVMIACSLLMFMLLWELGDAYDTGKHRRRFKIIKAPGFIVCFSFLAGLYCLVL